LSWKNTDAGVVPANRKRRTYELVVHEHDIVIYRVATTKIEVLRIKHTARQWPAK
jgi:plasmid stabilization system protein ParE